MPIVLLWDKGRCIEWRCAHWIYPFVQSLPNLCPMSAYMHAQLCYIACFELGLDFHRTKPWFTLLQDNALIIAVDDPPEDGLDSPLRLEKLANEVSLWIVFLVLYHCCPVFLSFDKQKVRLNTSLISSALIDVPLSRWFNWLCHGMFNRWLTDG